MSELFQIERPDWALFASLDTLSQKAGVPVRLLRRLALKELVDNALDAGGRATINDTDVGGYVIQDDGPGIAGSPEEIARLFSIDRPLVSAKLWRRPSRGALGNGLRVVAGALIGSGGGCLIVRTRNQELKILPSEDGGAGVETRACACPVGTKIEIRFGPHLPEDPDATLWADLAIMMAEGGKTYAGKPSVWHHDADSFYGLTKGAGSRFVRDFISGFDGCTGAKAGEIASGYLNRTCGSLAREEAASLLLSARTATDPVSHRRLGYVGQISELPNSYAKCEGMAVTGSREPKAKVPCVVEAWAQRSERSYVTAFVNRTPIVAELRALHTSQKQYAIFGCELAHAIDAPKKGEWTIAVNITTPHMPITSDGKTPDLSHFAVPICEAISRAIRKERGQHATGGEKLTQKEVFLGNLDAALDKASDHGKFRPSLRDLFYAIRPYVIETLEIEPTYTNFQKVITEFERENGEIEGLYREERGALYHPHTNEEVQLGTLEVEKYERPPWLYSSIVIVEKMGLIEAIKTVNLHKRLDFAPMTSRGFTTRALKDLIDKLAEHEEPLKVFCVTDADAAGTMIYETLVRETKARGARKIEVVNLGLLPWEAEEMGLAPERLEPTKSRRPVGQHVVYRQPRADGTSWEEWLQTARYELNAMGIPLFLEWLEKKLIEHGAEKVVPPAAVIEEEAREQLELELRKKITERILREADLEGQVANAMSQTHIPEDMIGPRAVAEWLHEEENEAQHWRDYVAGIVENLVEGGD